jgi:purine-binding chemotaxis protein CheW
MNNLKNDSEVQTKLVELTEQLRQLKEWILPTRAAAFSLPTGSIELVCCQIEKEQFAFYLPAVCEIVRIAKLTPLAGAPAAIGGLLNLRGTIIPVIDLRILLGYQRAGTQLNSVIFLIEADGVKRGFIVDTLQSVISITKELIEPADWQLSNNHYLLGITHQHGKLITLLDHTRLISIEEEIFLATINNGGKEDPHE